MYRLKKISLSVFLLCILILGGSCARKGKVASQSGSGAGESYFMGLRSLQKGERELGRRQLRSAAKNANPIIARKAREELAADIESIDERIKALLDLYHDYPDDNSLNVLCRELYTNKEYAKIINETSSLDLANCQNSIAYYRLSSLYIKKDSRFPAEFYKWCTERNFERQQYSLFSELEVAPPVEQLLALFYKKNYGAAYTVVKSFMDGENAVKMTTQFASTFGKIFLYGTTKYHDDGEYLKNFAESTAEGCKFYFYFYAARLFDRAENDRDKAEYCYQLALKNALTPELYDNALWYYFTSLLNYSEERAVKAVDLYKNKIHDPYYFDDFFDTLSFRLLGKRKWGLYYKAALLLRSCASKESAAKFEYVAARLLQQKIYRPKDVPVEQQTELLLRSALNSGTDLYYKSLAAARLSLTNDEFEKGSLSVLRMDDSFVCNTDAEELLLGYADFGFPERIYNEYLLYRDSLSADTVKKLSSFLHSCGKNQEGYYSQSVRIAARKLFKCERTLTGLDDSLYALSFPKGFSSYVEQSCEEFSVDESLIYALIRSESYFDPTVISVAGAVGLTQLMELTAGDVARKLKVEKYDLRDSETNIRFGSYYLSEMIRRLNGSEILAVFAYNAGITRVRNWVLSAKAEYGEDNKTLEEGKLPNDLFMEALPIAETREYGRKVVSACIMYAMIYGGKTPASVIADVMGIE